jgi:hypothetical protein
VALVNLLRDGSGPLKGMRERAGDLGIVLDEHLVRDPEGAQLPYITSTIAVAPDASPGVQPSVLCCNRTDSSPLRSAGAADPSDFSPAAVN